MVSSACIWYRSREQSQPNQGKACPETSGFEGNLLILPVGGFMHQKPSASVYPGLSVKDRPGGSEASLSRARRGKETPIFSQR